MVGSGAVDVTPSTRGLLATAVSVAAIAGLYAAPSGPAARLLALPLPRYLGQISYGTYLWHWPVILVTRDVFDVRPIVIAAIAGTVATGLAALSYEVFERPIRRAKPLDRFRWPVVGAGLTASVLAAVLVLPPILHANVRPVLANPSAGDLSAIAADAAWVEEPVPGRPRPGRRAGRRARRRRAVHGRRISRSASASPAPGHGSCWSATARRPMFVDALEALAQ